MDKNKSEALQHFAKFLMLKQVVNGSACRTGRCFANLDVLALLIFIRLVHLLQKCLWMSASPRLLAVQEKRHAIFCSVLLPGWARMVGLYFADNIYSFSLRENCLRRKEWDVFALPCCVLLCPTLPSTHVNWKNWMQFVSFKCGILSFQYLHR